MAKKSFIMYQNWAKLISNLEDDKAGMLIKAICAYANNEEVSIQDASINAIFKMIADKLSEDSEKYADVVKKRTDAINKRWQKNKEEIQNNSNEYKCIQMDSVTVTDTVTVTDKDIKEKKEKEKKPRFAPPTVEEVKEYCQERGNKVDADTFVDFYTAKGWKVGNNPMKDWKACVRTWEKRDKQGNNDNRASPITKFSNFEEHDYQWDDLEKRFSRN